MELGLVFHNTLSHISHFLSHIFISHFFLAFLSRISHFYLTFLSRIFFSHFYLTSRICISHFYLAFFSRIFISHFYLASRIFISHLAFFYLASRIFISHLTPEIFFFSYYVASRISLTGFRSTESHAIQKKNLISAYLGTFF